MINLAVMYKQGLGTEKNLAQAFAWIYKAAQAGSPLGQRILAEFYETGIGTEINEQESLRYYILAAKQGEPSAVQFLKTHAHLSARGPL